MRKFSKEVHEKKPAIPEKLTCSECGARVRHLQLHVKRNHGMTDRQARKVLRDAAFVNELEMELLKGNVSGTGTSKEETLVEKFARSKSGWRQKPTTALRQERQLKNLFEEAETRCGESDQSKLIRQHLDTIEEILLEKLAGHSAMVKSLVVALLEFSRFVSVREPRLSAEWDASMRRLDVWKRDATMMDHHREADLQDKMGESSYLPSKKELIHLRSSVHSELHQLCKKEVTKRREAVKMRRLVSTAILLDNYQRSGTIKNATMAQYEERADGILKVKDHKSRTSYGSANLVLTDVEEFLKFYVEKARPLLVREATEPALFPSSDPWEDMGEICTMFGVKRMTPTLLRKAASTVAYGSLTEVERRRVANHMTHRPETAYKSYAAKTRREDATDSVKRMKDIMYGDVSASSVSFGENVDDVYPNVSKDVHAEVSDGGGDTDCPTHDDVESTVPSSAGALLRQQRRPQLSPGQSAAIRREARRMAFRNVPVHERHALALMSQRKPLFDCVSPRAVETQLRKEVREMSVDGILTRSVVRRQRRVAK